MIVLIFMWKDIMEMTIFRKLPNFIFVIFPEKWQFLHEVESFEIFRTQAYVYFYRIPVKITIRDGSSIKYEI